MRKAKQRKQEKAKLAAENKKIKKEAYKKRRAARLAALKETN